MLRHKFCLLLCLVFISSTLLSSCSPPIPSYEPEPFVHEDIAFTSLDFYLPEPDELKTLIHAFVNDMKAAKSAKEQVALLADYDREVRRYTDMGTIAQIRFYQNTTDEKTKADYEYLIQLFAGVAQDDYEANKVIVESKYVKGLETYFGKDIIDQSRDIVRKYNPDYTELAVELSDLQNQYVQLASSYIEPTVGFSNQADALLSEMLPLRTRVAELAGYGSFVEYSYSDWSIELSDVKTFIDNMKQTVLPVYQKLADNGNRRQDRCPATLQVKPVDIKNEQDLYELSMQTLRSSLNEMNPLIDYTERNGMLDVMSRNGKMNGYYTFPLYGEQIPFVYTDKSAPDKIIHEFGHALEIYTWPKIELKQRLSTTPETMEVASTCMEVLATMQYEQLYGNTAEYARMEKTYDLVYSLLEQAMWCEFELALYENPDMTKDERNALYSELLDEYRIHPYPWASVQHFFISPLYTISYSIDSVVALDLLSILQNNPSRAEEVYMNYLRDCTQKDFMERLKNAGFRNPFEKQTLEDLAQSLDALFSSDEYQNPEQLKQAG